MSSSSSSSSWSSSSHLHQQSHNPYWSEDPALHSGLGTPFYRDVLGIIERSPLEVGYPEIRKMPGSFNYDFVYADDFVHCEATQPTTMDPADLDTILGGDFNPQGTPFDGFLTALFQLCRNYNYDLRALRVLLFDLRVRCIVPGPGVLEAAIANYKRSADGLWTFLSNNDPKSPEGGESPFGRLAVEFVKLNGYIFAIRAGASDIDDPIEFLFSSSSHLSLTSMYTSSQSSSSNSSSSGAPSSSDSPSSSSSSDSSSSDSSESESSVNGLKRSKR